jgi:hypothetical protein
VRTKLLRNAVGTSGRCHRGGEEEGEEAGQEELRQQPRPLGRARGGGGAVVAGEGRRRREEIHREAIWQGGAKQQGSNLGSVGVDGITDVVAPLLFGVAPIRSIQ